MRRQLTPSDFRGSQARLLAQVGRGACERDMRPCCSAPALPRGAHSPQRIPGRGQEAAAAAAGRRPGGAAAAAPGPTTTPASLAASLPRPRSWRASWAGRRRRRGRRRASTAGRSCCSSWSRRRLTARCAEDSTTPRAACGLRYLPGRLPWPFFLLHWQAGRPSPAPAGFCLRPCRRSSGTWPTPPHACSSTWHRTPRIRLVLSRARAAGVTAGAAGRRWQRMRLWRRPCKGCQRGSCLGRCRWRQWWQSCWRPPAAGACRCRRTPCKASNATWQHSGRWVALLLFATAPGCNCLSAGATRSGAQELTHRHVVCASSEREEPWFTSCPRACHRCRSWGVARRPWARRRERWAAPPGALVQQRRPRHAARCCATKRGWWEACRPCAASGRWRRRG